MDDSRERTWHWWLFIVLVLAGSIYGRTLEVHYRDRSRTAVVSETIHFEEFIAQNVSALNACMEQGRCESSSRPLFHPRAPGDYWDGVLLAQLHSRWPEFDAYYATTFRWNTAVENAVSSDGAVTDPAAAESLLSGPIPRELTVAVADARADQREVKRTGRLDTRVFGWGWKVLLSMLVVVPVATAPARIRRRRAITIASRFTRPTPTAANAPIPFGPSDNHDD